MSKYRHSLNPRHRLEGVPLDQRITTGQLRRKGSTIGLRLMGLVQSQHRYFVCLMLVYDMLIHTGDWEIRRMARAVVRGKKNPAG